MKDKKNADTSSKVRPDTMEHFRASLKKNRRLAELLGKS